MLFKYNSHTLVSFYFLSEYCLWFLHHPGYRFCRIGETKITPSGGNTDRRAPPNVAHVSGCIYKVLRCKKGPSSFGQPPSTTDCHRLPHLLLRDGCTSIRPHIVYSNWLFHLLMPGDSSTVTVISGTNSCISLHSSQNSSLVSPCFRVIVILPHFPPFPLPIPTPNWVPVEVIIAF